MLVRLARSVGPQGLSVRSVLVIAKRVDFVIAEDAQSLPRIDHPTNDLQGPTNLRATVDVIAQKNSLPTFGVTKGQSYLPVAQFSKKTLQLGGASVDVADDVVADDFCLVVHLIVLRSGMRFDNASIENSLK